MKRDKKEAELTLVDAPPARDRLRHPAAGAREVTIPGLWRTFRRGVWLVGLVTLIFVLLAVVALKLRTPVFEAGMTVAPASRDLASAGRLAAELEQYAGLAALGQTPGEFEPVSTLDRYLALLTSTRVAERLSDDRSLTGSLLPGRWDEESRSWRPPDGLDDQIRQAIFTFFGFPAWQEPAPAAIAERLTSLLEVRGTTGIYRLTLALSDPEQGVRLLEAMHQAADEILRTEALAEVRRQIAELEAELDGNISAGRRAALEGLLAARYQAEALLDAEQAYAAAVIDPPAASGWPSSLHPLLVLAFAAFVGALVGMFIVFLRDALRDDQSQDPARHPAA